ncbi:MAG: Nif11-like leader peptide family RiPP precursor [Synergistaceae bacterium]|jgi:predicted ribosomally synthesized peptide with nif11-like leader|nr:Nif11-like leader peptide family RiPP precursor [Synergistaceae bacterium]
MSVENLKKYGQLCAEDEKVCKRVKEIGVNDVDGQIAYGKSLGLEFSREDVEALASESGIDGKDELSEEDLKKVAGGIVTTSAVLGFLALAAVFAIGFTAMSSSGSSNLE